MQNMKKLSVTKFNDNISKYIDAACQGEVFYLTKRLKTKAVLIGKNDFEQMMALLKEFYE